MLVTLFNKVAGLQVSNFIEKRLQHRCFLVHNANFLRTTILKLFFYFTLIIYLFSIASFDCHNEKLWCFMVKQMLIKIRLCNPMTYVFKGHVKIVKIYMVKFHVSVLNRLKIMGFLWIQSIYLNIMPFLIKL